MQHVGLLQVRVRIKYTSFNPIDAKVRAGVPGRELVLPKVSGADVAGVVVEADPASRVQPPFPLLPDTNECLQRPSTSLIKIAAI